MERNFYHSDDFEEFIKEKADQYKMYPSDKVWKGINRSLHTRKKWYWSGFVVLLSGISYLAITDLMSPAKLVTADKVTSQVQEQPVNPQQIDPFSSNILKDLPLTDESDEVTSDFTLDDNSVSAKFEIPLKYLPGTANTLNAQKASVLISGLEPLQSHEQYNFEISWPVTERALHFPAPGTIKGHSEKIILHPTEQKPREAVNINWLLDNTPYKTPEVKTNRISWQLAFSPTVNYRKLTGNRNSKSYATTRNIPLAVQIDGDVDKLVNHKPALGFELGTHGLLKLNNRFTFKGGLQFNYSKYDIRAYKAPGEMATIALNSQTGNNTIVSYSDLRNFGGSSVEDLKNQYFQLSVPVGFEFRLFGDEHLQFNLASSIQPTYLLNSNTYLITTDFKNYTKEPSLVRKWNVNAGAEAFIAYERGGVKWQVGPQFRYQLLSSYKNEYPIKEYLMEYGIKVGITKTIR